MMLVKVEQLFFSNKGFVVLLKGDGDSRSLPIFIGDAEAHAIAIHINRIRMPRPLTHDLLKNTLDFLECRLMGVEVSSLKEGTFYARLMIERDGESMDMDARPSDATHAGRRSTGWSLTTWTETTRTTTTRTEPARPGAVARGHR